MVAAVPARRRRRGDRDPRARRGEPATRAERGAADTVRERVGLDLDSGQQHPGDLDVADPALIRLRRSRRCDSPREPRAPARRALGRVPRPKRLGRARNTPEPGITLVSEAARLARRRSCRSRAAATSRSRDPAGARRGRTPRRSGDFPRSPGDRRVLDPGSSRLRSPRLLWAAGSVSRGPVER